MLKNWAPLHRNPGLISDFSSNLELEGLMSQIRKGLMDD